MVRGVRLTGAGADLRVVDLRELSPERWFDIGRPPSDLAAASEACDDAGDSATCVLALEGHVPLPDLRWRIDRVVEQVDPAAAAGRAPPYRGRRSEAGEPGPRVLGAPRHA